VIGDPSLGFLGDFSVVKHRVAHIALENVRQNRHELMPDPVAEGIENSIARILAERDQTASYIVIDTLAKDPE